MDIKIIKKALVALALLISGHETASAASPWIPNQTSGPVDLWSDDSFVCQIPVGDSSCKGFFLPNDRPWKLRFDLASGSSFVFYGTTVHICIQETGLSDCYGGWHPPTGSGADWYAGWEAQQQKNYPEAIRLYTQALSAINSFSYQRLEILYNRGVAAWLSGDNALVVSDLSEIVDDLDIRESDDLYINARYFRGHAHRTLGNLDLAAEDYSAVIRYSDFPDTYKWRGVVYLLKKNWDLAIVDFTVLIARMADKNSGGITDANPFYERGYAHYRKGDYIRALADYNDAIRLNSKISNFFYERGMVWQKMENWSAAIADYSEAIRLQPNFWSAFYRRGLVLKKLGDTAKGEADLVAALKINPDAASSLDD